LRLRYGITGRSRLWFVLACTLEFFKGCGRVLEQAGIMLPVGHLTGAELTDDDSLVDLDEQD